MARAYQSDKNRFAALLQSASPTTNEIYGDQPEEANQTETRRVCYDRIVGATKQKTSKEKAIEKRKESRKRRGLNKKSFNQAGNAWYLAVINGLRLDPLKRGYKLWKPGGWLLEIYPATRRLVYSANRRGPLFHMKEHWTVLDVVKAVVKLEAK